ncbi:hypothetical protein ACFQ3X_40995 [Plantactinospora endophytica]
MSAQQRSSVAGVRENAGQRSRGRSRDRARQQEPVLLARLGAVNLGPRTGDLVVQHE